MKIIKKIDILSVAKIFGLICGGFYFIVGVVVNVSVFIFGFSVLRVLDVLGFGSGLLASMVIAVLAGAVAFISGAILAWLYNTAAGLLGGIVFEAEDYVKPVKKEAAANMPSMTFTAPEDKIQEPPRETF